MQKTSNKKLTINKKPEYKHSQVFFISLTSTH